jgi:hypothetical protein
VKVICLTKDYAGSWSSFSAHDMLTIGKWYDVLEEGTDYYRIKWNKGYEANLSKSYFKTVEQLRQDKINDLGI